MSYLRGGQVKGIALHDAEEGQYVEIFVGPEEFLADDEPEVVYSIPWVVLIPLLLVFTFIGFLLGLWVTL